MDAVDFGDLNAGSEMLGMMQSSRMVYNGWIEQEDALHNTTFWYLFQQQEIITDFGIYQPQVGQVQIITRGMLVVISWFY